MKKIPDIYEIMLTIEGLCMGDLTDNPLISKIYRYSHIAKNPSCLHTHTTNG